jgi:uncharacterized membrane protein YfcA
VAGFCGAAVGLVLGSLRLPLVLLASGSPASAAGTNVAVSAAAALVGGTRHARAGRVDWRVVAWMTPPSVAGAVAGALASSAVPANALRIIIGTALLVFGLDLLRPRRPPPSARLNALDVRAAVVAGVVIGLLGGLIGLILGSLRMPALVRWVGEEPLRAIGTNLVVGIAVGAAGIVGHVPGGIDWTLFLVGAAASIPGALLGSRLTGKLSPATLLRAVGAILLVAGTAAILQGAL